MRVRFVPVGGRGTFHRVVLDGEAVGMIGSTDFGWRYIGGHPAAVALMRRRLWRSFETLDEARRELSSVLEGVR